MNYRIIIKKAVSAIIFCILFCITVNTINKSAAALPDCFGYISNSYGEITISEISEQRLDNISINAQSVSAGYARSVWGMYAFTKIIATDENYTDFHSINITKGAFDNAGVLISEVLANKFFKSIDIIGAEFYLNDIKITVAGVYKPDKSFLNAISSDGQDYIIVPYNLDLIQNNAVDYLYIKDKTNTGFLSAAETELNLLLDGKLSNYTKVNLSENKKIILQFKNILFLIMGLIIFIALLKKLFNLILVLTDKETEKNIWFYAKSAIITAILIIIPVIASFELYIPANFFPADKNILHIPHYSGLFIDFIRSYTLGSYYFYNSLYFWSVLFIMLLIIINILIFIKVIYSSSSFFGS